MRIGDLMIETHSAIVSFDDLTATIVPDDLCEPPWDSCDGYAHTVRRACAYDTSAMRGSVYSDRERKVIALTDDDYGLFDYMRERGASRQVAKEAVAAQRRRTLDQLVDWYSNGWEWWAVQCEYRGCESSLCGIDTYDYAETVCVELVWEVVHQLEAKGYTVTDKPNRHYGYTRKDKQANLRRNLTGQNWAA